MSIIHVTKWSPWQIAWIPWMFLAACGRGNTLDQLDSTVDGGQDARPMVVNCTADEPTAEATMQTGIHPGGGYILPGGRRIRPWGTLVPLFGFPTNLLPLPDGQHVIVTGSGHRSHTLWLIDIDQDQIIDQQSQKNLFYGLATNTAATRLYAGGGEGGNVYVYDIDLANGQLVPQDPIATPTWAGGVALSPDDSTLYVLDNDSRYFEAYDLATSDRVARVDVGRKPYDIRVDATRGLAYISLWWDAKVVFLDLDQYKVADSVPVGKNPQAMVMSLDAKKLYVTCTDEDDLEVIDLDSHAVVQRGSVGLEPALPRGVSPSHVTLSPDGQRLLVTAAGLNAVEVYDSATLQQVGAIPAAYYPSAVAVSPSGDDVYVLNAKGIGTGPGESGAVEDYMWGNLQITDMPDDQQLDDGAQQAIEDYRRPVTVSPKVTCQGEPPIFPIPTEAGGLTPIKHVILLIRENKTYDAELGDLEEADGDPDLVLFGEWETPNLHALARQFTNLENYYTNGEISIQGHQWFAAGMANDFIERTCLDGANHRSAADFVTVEASFPKGGYAWAHMKRYGIPFVDWGEALGVLVDGQDGWDLDFPSPGFDMTVLDVDKAQYVVDKILVDGYLPNFVYLLLPNNHTFGMTPGQPTPQSMVADNDQATGMVIDALSHSPFWSSSVVFIVEDDPQQGADHVDMHRSLCLVVSPWAKHAYVSDVNSDISSVWRSINMIVGAGPLSVHDANAAPMYDAFTNTADLSPYDTIPRNVPEAVNPKNGIGAEQSAKMDFSGPDRAEGLAQVLWRSIKGTKPPWPPPPFVKDDDDD